MITGKTYQEVYEVLSLMDKQTVMKIPIDILKNIKNKRNSNFKTKINKNDLFNENNMSQQATDVLCWLNYLYLINDKQKIKINQKIEDIKRLRFNPDNIFKNNEN